jgi:YYY domain-containing protein
MAPADATASLVRGPVREETAENGNAAKEPSSPLSGEAASRLLQRLLRPRFGWLLFLVLLAGFVLRLWGINWDQYTHLHPDERFLTMVETDLKVPHSLGQYFDTAESPLNPYNTNRNDFAYGTFPIFLTKITGEVLQHNDFFPLNLIKDGLAKAFGSDGQHWNDYAHINLVGRLLSTLFDVGTIYIVFLTGKLLYDRRIGLLAALLLSLTVLHIQLAHFFAVDSFLAFFSALTLYYCIRIVKFGGWGSFTMAGLACGFAVACKLSGIFLGPIIALAVVCRMWSPGVTYLRAGGMLTGEPSGQGHESEGQGASSDWARFGKPLLGFLLAIVVAFIVFRVAQPYAFKGAHGLDFFRLAKIWVEDMKRNALLQSGGNFNPNWQWVGRTSYLFPLQNIVLWGMGFPLGIAAWGGFLWAAWRLIRKRETNNLLLLAWVALYFGYWGRNFNPTMRYFLPIYPALVLLAAYGLRELWGLARSEALSSFLRRGPPRLAAAAPSVLRAAAVAVVVLTALWALAFTNIYRRPLSRVQASAWMIDNLPENAVPTCEAWDDCVPFGLPGKPPAPNTIQIEPYGADLSDPSSNMLQVINEADYIVLTSNRLYGSIPRTPAKWPMTSNYYRLLFEEKLGFRLVKTFTSYPSLFGVTIPDDAAEEVFTVYDHPKVWLFEKTEEYSPERFMTAVGDTCLQVPAKVTPAEAAQNALLMRPDDCRTQREGGTWTSIFDPGSFSNRFPLVTWLLVIEVMSLALLPFGLLVFRSLPDRGYLLLKPLGLLVVSWLVWMGASLKLVHFTRGSIIAALVLVVLFGVALGWARRQELLTFVRQHWRGLLLSEALFLGAFLIFYWIRMLDPDLWHPFRGGEKPMDFAYLNAVTRSTTMPPYDPWFAGGYLNYYYFGQFMTATLIKLTGTLPEISYNLAVPMYFALTVGATYSVCFNLAEATRRRIRWRPGFTPLGQSGTVLAGLLGAALLAVAGNLHGLYQTANRFSKVSDWHVGHGIFLLSGLVGMLGGMWKAIVEGGVKLPPFDYWAPSRMMPPQISITEFPFFTFLFADLHAHLMAIPFDTAILGTGLALVLAGNSGGSEDSAGAGQATSWLGVVVMGLLIGALRPINSWDYPPFLLLGMAAILIGEWAIDRRLSWPVAGRAALKAAALAVLSVAFFLPFWQNYHLFYKGFQASAETTPFHQFLGHFGLLLFGAMTLVAVLAWRTVRRRRPWEVIPLYILTLISVLALVCLAMLFSDQSERLPITIKGLSASDFLGDLFTNDIPVVAFSLAVIAALLLLIWHELRGRRPDAPIRLFVLVVIGLALTLSAGVDILTLDGDIARMNTVFKFYIHVWLLLAVASAFGIWYVFAVVRQPPRGKRASGTARQWTGVWRGVWVLALAILLLGALIYPLSGTRARVDSADRFDQYHGHSINGMEYMKYAAYGGEEGKTELKYEYDAIWWMRENVEGTPVIVEGQSPSYTSLGSRFSIYTGLPTVIGWGWHQQQQRAGFGYMIDDRERDLKEFYSSSSIDSAVNFLRKYRVSYVIVGQVERYNYPAEGIAKFAQMDGQELQLVYQNPKVQIYRVLSLPPLIPTGSPTR